MNLLEQKYKTDIKNLFYTKQELEEHDNFMKKYVFPLDDDLKKWKFSANSWKYNLFILAYGQLSDNIKDNLKEVYIEYNILYYKWKIKKIIEENSFKQDKKSFDEYLKWLRELVWENNTEKYLLELKEAKK